ncbi:MAG TPA: NAD(P)H-dependent oxidoreductase subunit E, partial [Ramlibacter sp.]|nr:NAD(P)H-dependent oxidoreductase subunit E [Ramlibacter sp.]
MTTEIVLGTADSLRRGLHRTAQLKGRQPDEAALGEVRDLIVPRPPEGHRPDLLLEYLHRLNDRWGALHKPHLVALAREMNLPMAQVQEVASFYHHFELLPDGGTAPALTVRVCESVSCALAGGRELLARLPQLVGREVRVVAAPCIGRCEQAPAALVGQVAVPRATLQALLQAVNDECARPVGQRGVARGVQDHIGYASYRAQGGYGLAAAVVNGEEDPEEVLATLEASGLRGLGGAGFPLARKWRIVREQPEPRLMAVNIDEGEPGTFKDRWYLERDPHRFLEGMLVAAQVVGTEAVYIYLRDEYHDCRVMLEQELALLLADPPCPLPTIELRRGAGAYICGEESAM